MCVEKLITQFIGEVHQYCVLKNKMLFQLESYYSEMMDCYFIVYDDATVTDDKELSNYILKLMNRLFFNKGIMNVCYYYGAEYMNEVKLQSDLQRYIGKGLVLEGYCMDDLTVQLNMNSEGSESFNIERGITVFYDEACASIELRFEIYECGLKMTGNLVGQFIYDGMLLLEQVDEMLSVNAVVMLGQKLDEMIKRIMLSVNLPLGMFTDWDVVGDLIENEI